MPADVDPFTLVYQTLWSAFTEHAAWTAEVFKVGGSLVRFDTNDYPPNLGQDPGANKSPMVYLIPGRRVVNPFAFDTGAATMTLSHQLVMVYENLAIEKPNKVAWVSLQALSKAGLYLGLPRLVQKVTVSSAADLVGTPNEWANGHKRIVTLWTIDVACWIKTELVATGDYESTL